MREPRDVIDQMELHPELSPGRDERFTGYGVMASPFDSGHLLAMRRFPATSVGPGYTSIWYWHADGRWTFYSNASSRAEIDGVIHDRLRPLPRPIRLGDFWLPQTGLFAIGRAYFEPFDPQRHLAAATMSSQFHIR